MALELIEILSGIFSIIFVAISTLVGLRIALRYREMKDKQYLFVGLTWILLVESWWSSSISFIIALVDGIGLYASPAIYFAIGETFVPWMLVIWLWAFTGFIYKDKQKIVLIIFSVIGIIFDIFYIYFLIVDPGQIGTLQGPVDVTYASFVRYFLIFTLLTLLVTGIKFGLTLRKSDNPEHKVKGMLLILAWILLIIGAFCDSSLDLNEITLPIVRMILIISSIFFYGGFILPDWMKKIFIRT